MGRAAAKVAEAVAWPSGASKTRASGYDRFHGQLDFGNAGYHFAVVRVTVNAKGEWGLEDEDCPYGHDQDLRRPLGFEIEGVEGKWCLIFTPLS